MDILKRLFNSSYTIMYSVLLIVMSISIRVMVFDAENATISEMFGLLEGNFLDIFTLLLLWIGIIVLFFMVLKWIFISIKNAFKN